MLRKSVGNRPALIGKKLAVAYHRGDNYFEADIDAGSSRIARWVTKMVLGYVKVLKIDLLFLLEGRCKEELPERLLSCIELIHLDPSRVKLVE